MISPISGTYSNPIQVTITAEPGATIRYTTNGEDPSQGAGTSSSGSVTIPVPKPTRVRAWVYGNRPPSSVSEQSYDFRAVPPIIVLDPPVIGTGPVTLSNVTASIIRGAGDSTSSLSYSTNNGVSWVAYTESLKFGRNFALQAKAEVAGWRPSDPNPSQSVEFKVAPVQLDPPDGKSAVNPFAVTVTTTNPVPAEIWYTVNGPDPTPNGAGSIQVLNNKITVTQSGLYKFAAFTPGWTQSEVKSATYSIVSGDLVFSPWTPTNAFVSDKPIEITITSPSTNRNLRIRVGWTEASVSAANPSPIIITNGGKVRVTRSPSTLYAQAYGEGITTGPIRQGLYAVRMPDVEVGDRLPTPGWASTHVLPILPEKQFNIQQVENGGITNRVTNSWQYFTLVSLGRNGTNAVQAPYAVVRSPLQTVEWKYPAWETNIQVLQTITPRKNPDSVVTLYHTENVAPTISQNLMVSLAQAPNSFLHYQPISILGHGTGRSPADSDNAWIDTSTETPLLRAAPPVTGELVIELRDAPPSASANGFLGMRVIQVKPYLPDAATFLADLGTELQPSRGRPGSSEPVATPRVTVGNVPGTLNGYIYQHSRPGQATDGKVFAIRRNPLEFQMEVVWRHLDEGGRVVWPYEIRRYLADWPSRMQIYVRGQAPDPTGPHVAFPFDLNPAVVPSQEPPGHASIAASDPLKQVYYLNSRLLGANTEGRSLVFMDLKESVDGVNWIGFQPVRSVLNSDPRAGSQRQNPWTIGTEITDAYHPGPYPEYSPGYIQVPQSRLISGRPADRYAPLIYGRFGATHQALNQTTSGQIFGVNEGALEIWWSNITTNRAWPRGWNLQWPSLVRAYNLVWPGTNAVPKIILAKQSGEDEKLNVDPGQHHNSSIYWSNSPEAPGYNPNEEHAFIYPGSNKNRVFALRDDLNLPETSKPYVLHQYQIGSYQQARWSMRTYAVTLGDLEYPMTAGRRIQPPTPLDRFFDTQEKGVSGPYWADRKDEYWAKAAGDDGGNADVIMHYWYPAQLDWGFFIPGKILQQGQMLPWLDVRAKTPDIPIDVQFDVAWPTNPPVLSLNETLVTAKNRLPDIAPQKSVDILYQQRGGSNGIVKLIDPLFERVVEIAEGDLRKSRVRLLETPDRLYFNDAPAHLQKLLYYDKLRNQLIYSGSYKVDAEAGFGEPLLQINVIPPRDHAKLVKMVPEGRDRDALIQAFNRLSTNIVRVITNQDSHFEFQALTAGLSQGTGFVTLAFQNNTHRTLPGDPISLEVLKVMPPLYTGEIKVLYPVSPLDEKLTLRHSGDFAGEPGKYEFEWKTIPATYELGFREDPAKWAARRTSTNPTPRIVDGGISGRRHAIATNDPPGMNNAFVVVTRDLATASLWNGTRVELISAPEIVPDRPEVVWNLTNRVLSIRVNLRATTTRAVISAVRGASTPFDAILPDEDGGVKGNTGEGKPGMPPNEVPLNEWQTLNLGGSGEGVVDYTIEGASILTLSDNWFVCRYRPLTNSGHPLAGQWSQWTAPALAEGWVKRVLRGNNEFNLGLATQIPVLLKSYLNSSNRFVSSMVSLAGPPYEGNVALNLDSARSTGLIALYETVLRRAMDLSVEVGKNYDPANVAVLLAATRLAELYGLLGNEAYADAADPTLTFGTWNGAQVGSLSTSVHAFQNQATGINSLLHEELALLRGRAEPGSYPFYNRLPPNFTGREGEAAYSLNYGISDVDGRPGIDVGDAFVLYPQGHGDAWGHFLSASKVYYRLLRNESYTWVPQSEDVSIAGDVGGKPVPVDYQDERRFAKIAASKARTGAEIVNLTYRERYSERPQEQWQGYRDDDATRAWGVSEWASRAGQGAFLDWAVANALLPEADSRTNFAFPDLQKIDRGTMRELGEIAAEYRRIQVLQDQADSGLNPLGVSPNTVPFDLDPSGVGGSTRPSHFEQSVQRAVSSLKNALDVWNVAQGAAGLLRDQFESQDKLKAEVDRQENQYRGRLIEIFGYPYAEDTVRNGGIYSEEYVQRGPDLYHFNYVDTSLVPGLNQGTGLQAIVSRVVPPVLKNNSVSLPRSKADERDTNLVSLKVNLSTEGFGMVKPKAWTKRKAGGEIQKAMSALVQAQGRYINAMRAHDNLVLQIEEQNRVVRLQALANDAELETLQTQISIQRGNIRTITTHNATIAEIRGEQASLQNKAAFANIIGTALAEALPTVVGIDNDPAAPMRSAIRTVFSVIGQKAAEEAAQKGLEEQRVQGLKEVAQAESSVAVQAASRGSIVARGRLALETAENQYAQLIRQEASLRLDIYLAVETLRQTADEYLQTVDRGLRLLEEVDWFRAQTAADLIKYRYRDLLFRSYRNDGIQKYRSQFDLAGRYVYLAAKAYDYETSLLPEDSQAGLKHLADIVRARTLGPIASDGRPLPTSVTGDPGLAGALGRMVNDFEIVKGRYGINAPVEETLRFSLRRELFRLGSTVKEPWQAVLQAHRVANLLDHPVYRRYCTPSHSPSSTSEPALVIPFGTHIEDGLNLFGHVKASGDSAYSRAYWATKIRSVGVGLIGYDVTKFARTPRVYLVPAGLDMMRVPGSPTLVRQFNVVDQLLPFPSAVSGEIIGKTDYLPMVDTVSVPSGFLGIRTIPDFIAYYNADNFDERTKSNSRLVGRSVWNTQWVLILRGRELDGADPNRGLDNLILGSPSGQRRSGGLTDIELRMTTDASSGQ